MAERYDRAAVLPGLCFALFVPAGGGLVRGQQHHPGLAGLAGLDAAFMVVAWAAGAVVLLWVDEPLRAWLERAWRARAKLPVRAAAAR